MLQIIKIYVPLFCSSVQTYQICTRARANAVAAKSYEGDAVEEEKNGEDTFILKKNVDHTSDDQFGEGGVPRSEAGRRSLPKAIPLLDSVSKQRETRLVS